jgi:hypothetical protein
MGKSNASMSWYLQLFITAPVLSLRQFRAAALVLGFQTWKDSNAGTDRVVFADAGLAGEAESQEEWCCFEFHGGSPFVGNFVPRFDFYWPVLNSWGSSPNKQLRPCH